MNTYICFYRNQRYIVEATTSHEAQTKAAAHLKAKKAYSVAVMLHSLAGVDYAHSTASL